MLLRLKVLRNVCALRAGVKYPSLCAHASRAGNEAGNPANAQANAEHVFMVAEFDVMKEGMAPEAAMDKVFKRVEEIFAKYPIEQA